MTMLLALGFLLAQDPKLNRNQDTAIRNAEKYVNGFENDLKRMKAGYEKLKTNPDPAFKKKNSDAVVHNLGIMIDQLDGLAEDMKKTECPDAHSRVKAIKERMDKVRADIDALKKDFGDLSGSSAKASDTKSYPHYDQDMAELERIGALVGLENFDKDVPTFNAFVEIFKQYAELAQWHEQRLATYAPLIAMSTPEGKAIKAKFDATGRGLSEFKRRADSFVNNLSGRFKDELSKAAKLMGVAREEKKYHYFAKGGMGLQAAQAARESFVVLRVILTEEHEKIKSMKAEYEAFLKAFDEFSAGCKDDAAADLKKQILDRCSALESQATAHKSLSAYKTVLDQLAHVKPDVEKLAKLVGADDARAKEASERHAGLEKKVTDERDALRTQEVAAARAPKEVYSGADKEELRKKLVEKWNAAYPKEEILEVRFSGENWKRVTRWDWSKAHSSWELYDMSELYVTVIVKANDTEAVCNAAVVYKDHRNKDAVVFGVYIRGAYERREMLIANLK